MSIPFFTPLNQRINRFIGLAGLDPALGARVRAEQIANILRLTPAMMGGNAVIAVVVVTQYLDHRNLPYVVAWAVLTGVMVIAGMRAWSRTRQSSPRLEASQRSIRRAVFNAALLGILWGILPLITIFGEPDAPQRFLVAAIMVGMICGGGFALAVVPMAVLAFTLPVFAGSAATLLQSFTVTDQFVAVLLVTFWGIIAAASLSNARVFIGRLVAVAESTERGAVIGMLLKDFEDHASDWLWSTDAKGRFERVSERFADAAAIPAPEMTGMTFFDVFGTNGAEKHPGFLQIIDHMRSEEAFREMEMPVSQTGVRHWWKLSAQPYYSDAQIFLGYRGVASDVTERRKAEDRVAYLAHHDDLTGLANRANFAEHLAEAVKQLEQFEIGFALLMIDLDQFKAVNDTRGHEIGDQLLVKVARRFSSTASGKSIVGRLGGDEFVVIVPNPPDRESVTMLAEQLIGAAREKITIAEIPVRVGASIGIAFAPEHGTRSDQLLRNADLALYRAKQAGRNTFRIFETEMDRRAQEKRVLERQVSQALDLHQFELNYQPLIDVESNRVSGFEALVRWYHPDRGQVSPDVFIPVAEQTGAIKAIGDWVLKQACLAASDWPNDLTVSVNLSARQFETGRIIKTVREALEHSALDPKKLEIEITESVLINRPDETIGMLNELRAIGVSIAIDDFGTGYSSLSYLWKFPFDKIKLDQSFVAAIETDKIACDILRIIGSLGETLDMRITAEGVETVEQAVFLRSIACHQLQGFYFSRPLAAEELPAFLIESLSGRLAKDGRRKASHKRKASGDT